MRQKILLPVIGQLSVKNYDLYPGVDRSGLELPFPDGVTVLAGVNGVGKTTLLNLMMRMLLGPLDRAKVDRELSRVSDRDLIHDKKFSFFKDRVSKPLGETATATMTFYIGKTELKVTRFLSTMELKSASINRKKQEFKNEFDFALKLAALSGLSTPYDFHICVRYLQFFTEERLPALWSPGAQFEFFKMFFFDEAAAKKIDKAFAKVQSLDSDVRNRTYQLNLRRKQVPPKRPTVADEDLQRLDAQIALAQTAHDLAAERFQAQQRDYAELLSSSKTADAKFDEAEAKLSELLAHLQHADAAFIAQALPDLDDKLQFLMLGLGSGRGCFVCGKGGHKEAMAIGRTLKGGKCFVCQSPIQGKGKSGNVESLSAARVRQLEASAATVKAELTAIGKEREEIAKSYEPATKAMRTTAAERADTLRKLEGLKAQRPASTTTLTDLEAEIDREVAAIAAMDVDRKARAAEFREAVQAARGSMDDIKEELRAKLTEYAEAFLREEVKVVFSAQDKFKIATGSGSVNVPTFQIKMTSSTHETVQERLTSDSVSESQKEFLDLAFRMAVLDMISRDGATMLVMETPEASLDAWFMLRAADLMRHFAPSDSTPSRKLIATSNLNGTDMIPALLGLVDKRGRVRKLAAEDGDHFVNLLGVTAEARILKDDESRERIKKELGRFTNV